MNRPATALLSATTLASALSAAAILVLRLWFASVDEFSADAHPLEPWARALHILVAPVLVFAVGWVFGEHVLPRLRQGAGARRSGLALGWLAAGLVLSGTALTLVSGERLRLGLAWVHGLCGAAFVCLLAAHAWLGRRSLRSAADAELGASRAGPGPGSGALARLARSHRSVGERGTRRFAAPAREHPLEQPPGRVPSLPPAMAPLDRAP
jgi:hypothetical protein